MDSKGNIYLEYEKHPPDAVPLGKLPDKKCKDCYGRGFVRYVIENVVKTEPCHCTYAPERQAALRQKEEKDGR